ncbi:MAG: hypothetical protein RR317_04395, partial [Bilophila sp.]
ENSASSAKHDNAGTLPALQQEAGVAPGTVPALQVPLSPKPAVASPVQRPSLLEEGAEEGDAVEERAIPTALGAESLDRTGTQGDAPVAGSEVKADTATLDAKAPARPHRVLPASGQLPDPA